MSRDLLAEVAGMLFPTAEMVDVRGWGESLLAPNIDGVIGAVAAHGARCRVVTNLSLNKPRTLDLLADLDAMIDVSLDAVRQEIVDVARTGTRFSLVDRNLRRLAARYDGRPGLRIIATVQRATLGSLTELVRYSAELGGPPGRRALRGHEVRPCRRPEERSALLHSSLGVRDGRI